MPRSRTTSSQHPKSNVYTRTGDTGDTSLACGSRIPKDDLRIEAYGTIDELSSVLGVVSALLEKQARTPKTFMQEAWQHQVAFIDWLQDKLFTLSSMIATANLPAGTMPIITDEDVAVMEKHIDAMEAILPPLKNFILPGGSELASFIHLARTICRRAERNCTTLNRETPLPEIMLPFLNRLSDDLFVFSRWVSYQQAQPEKIWLGRKAPEPDVNGRVSVRRKKMIDTLTQEGISQLNLFGEQSS